MKSSNVLTLYIAVENDNEQYWKSLIPTNLKKNNRFLKNKTIIIIYKVFRGLDTVIIENTFRNNISLDLIEQ